MDMDAKESCRCIFEESRSGVCRWKFYNFMQFDTGCVHSTCMEDILYLIHTFSWKYPGLPYLSCSETSRQSLKFYPSTPCSVVPMAMGPLGPVFYPSRNITAGLRPLWIQYLQIQPPPPPVPCSSLHHILLNRLWSLCYNVNDSKTASSNST